MLPFSNSSSTRKRKIINTTDGESNKKKRVGTVVPLLAHEWTLDPTIIPEEYKFQPIIPDNVLSATGLPFLCLCS
jgi:hypothetical protein